MIVATWNVNSIRARLERLLPWIDATRPDVLCMQETKVVDDIFPREEFESRGYHLAIFGERTYNGVAIASRVEPLEIMRGMPDEAHDCERRFVATRIAGDPGPIWIVNVYAPNGGSVDSPRFAAKLAWFDRLRTFLETHWQPSDPVLICGDFNVAPEERDVHDPDRWRGQILFHPEEQAALGRLMGWGLKDAFRLHVSEGGHYTWWDYRAGAFHRGWGLRIDLALVTEPLAARCRRVTIDREARKGPKPSDHAPVIVAIE